MAKKICLDAGHYGKYNRSPAVRSYYESEMNWKLHLLLKKELESYGFEVITTRKDQAKDLALTSRGKASRGCDLFLSIHSNAVAGGGVNESVDYPVAYVQISGKGDEIGEALAFCVEAVMDTKQEGRISSKKGNNGDYYGVLRGAASVGTTGIILEHSFHTNTRSTNWLLQDANLQRMAEAEAAVIAKHFGLTKVPEPVQPAAPAEPLQPSTIYRVQVGAFTKKANAEKKLQAVKAAGFEDAFVACVGGELWRVQVGAYSVKANAEKKLQALKAAGFSGFVTSLSGDPVAEPKKSLDEIAKEVINGKWGNGSDRKKRLAAAGYDYSEVQKRVNQLLK